MPRSLTVLFRRDHSRNRQSADIRFGGYRLFWPDGREVAVGLKAFCQHGERLLGLDRQLEHRSERLIEVLCFPVPTQRERMTRLPGSRVRRFCLERRGPRGLIHFIDGTATEVDFIVGRDEPRVLAWIGLTGLADGDSQWLDLAARPAEVAEVRASA